MKTSFVIFYFYSNCVVSSPCLKRCFELWTKEVGAEWESGNNAFRRHSERPRFCQGNDAMKMMTMTECDIGIDFDTNDMKTISRNIQIYLYEIKRYKYYTNEYLYRK